MNKKLKIATAAVSVVMAGTMAVGMFGCVKPKPKSTQEKYQVAAEDAIKDVTLNINIGDAAQRSISFGYGELLSGTVKLPDGNNYTSSSLKPAWAAFEKMVGCHFNDVWKSASKKIETAKSATADGSKLSDMDIITDGAANVSKFSTDLLDLSNYLEEMPNYKKFLDANPIVRLSLTSDTDHGSMYYAPYFDGNNDIEKYELFKTNWVETLLDGTDAGDTETTYASHGAVKKAIGGEYKDTLTTSTAIESFMGKTGKWKAEVLDKDGKKLDAGITVNYDKALAAAKGSDGLGAAVTAAAGKAYTGDSGNIVDIMNFAINEKEGAVTGAQLKKILNEYVKVAYYVGDTDTAFYTQEGYKLSDVFAGYSAAWDVDLYAAIGRVLVTNPSILKSGKTGHIGDADATPLKNLYLLSARTNDMQRMIDSVSLIGQLYGVRGLESKNLYSYVGSDGKIKDPRGDAKSYEAMERFHTFWQEGLITDGVVKGSDGKQSYYAKDTQEALSTYDYVNTQTPGGFQLEEIVNKYALEDGYYYTPIITPVSKWNDGKEQVMRFTESWRTTKDTGFCVPVANVKDNPEKLRAVLTFIDKMFSNDGQILLTYGPMASSATANDGFWYNAEATTDQVNAGTYFEYGGKKLYSTVQYAGSYQPTICANVYNAYYGKSVNDVKFDASSLTYAGGDEVVKVPDTKNDKVANKAKFEEDTYYVNSKGEFVKAAKDSASSADVYVVKATVAANTAVTGEACYIVTDKGLLAGKDGKRVPLISNTVSQWTTNATLNYTNFARYVIGSALPIGNKLQSFEFQLTSAMGRKGATVVNAGLGSPSDPTDGVIKHTVNVMTKNLWYTVVPTLLPYSVADTSSLTGDHNRLYTGDAGNYFSNNKNDNTNLYWQIIKYGMDAGQINAKYSGLGLTSSGTVTAKDIMQRLETVDGYTAYVNIKNKAWQASRKFYDAIK